MKLKFDQGRERGEEKEGDKVIGAKIIGAYMETEEDDAKPLVPVKQMIAEEEETDEEEQQNVTRRQKVDPYQIVHFREEYAFDLVCTAEDKVKENKLKELASRKAQALIDHLQSIKEEAGIANLKGVEESARSELQKLRKLKEDLDEE